ncbi:MAG: peptide transporter, partial [Thermoprotei archaeon]
MNKGSLAPILVLILLVLSVIPFTATPTQAQTGQPVTEITWKVRLNRDAAILEVANGDADAFAWSSPLPQYQDLDPTVLGKMKLIRSTTTYVDIALNPAANVIDPNGPGYVEQLDYNITGTWLPGLIYWDSPTDFNSNWVNITDITDWSKVHFNPFGIGEIRYALNFLINRDLIVRTIYGGSAAAALGAIRPSHPAYPRLKHVYDDLGLTPAGDQDKAKQMFEEAMANAKSVLQNYGFDLYLKDDSSSPTGKYWYLKKPDGSEEPITVYFVIRVEDERLEVGRQISTWMEKIWNIKVVRIERERSVVTPIIYGTNPVTTSETLGGIVWTLYTEGWVSMGEDIDVWGRYDIAFFYSPLRGYGPNHRVKSWWYWFNSTEYNWGVQLYYGSYTQQNVDELWALMEKALKAGLLRAPRVFVTENWEFAPVNRDRVTQLVPGVASGIWTPWALRTLQTTDGKATIVEYSSQGALFMSAWNTVLGFNDVYSELMGRLVRDFDFYSSPINGMPVPIRVKSYKVTYDVTVPDDALVFNPKDKKWEPLYAGETEGPFGD